MVRMAVITGFLGQTRDRFHLYNEPKTVEQKFALLAGIRGCDGVEIVYPYEVSDPALTRGLLRKYRLKVAAVNVNVKAEPEFLNGGLTSTKKAVREKAIRFIKASKDFAAAIGADKVTCCPLGDGFEFAFQCDYRKMWGCLVDAFGECGAHRPEIPLFVEYKPSETRGKCFIDSAAKTLCLLHDIGLENMGVTLDFGHSVYGSEQPAEAAALVASSPYRLYVHVNDNDGRWDWDYFCGARHFLEYVEFLYWLKKIGYTDFLTSDTSPTRWDIRATFEANSRITNRIWSLLDRIDDRAFSRLIAGGDYLKTWRFIEREFLGLK